jgi:hypothetical protein
MLLEKNELDITLHAIERYQERLGYVEDHSKISRILIDKVYPNWEKMKFIDGRYPLGNYYFAVVKDNAILTVIDKRKNKSGQ